jgi:hypothetical protein
MLALAQSPFASPQSNEAKNSTLRNRYQQKFPGMRISLPLSVLGESSYPGLA